MKIEIDPLKLEECFKQGLLHPSDLKCLDTESKQIVKNLCIKLCCPTKCANCSAHKICAKPTYQPFKLQIPVKSSAISYSYESVSKLELFIN